MKQAMFAITLLIILVATPCLAQRQINAAGAVKASTDPNKDTLVTISVHNPSSVTQTVNIKYDCKGAYWMKKRWGSAALGGPILFTDMLVSTRKDAHDNVKTFELDDQYKAMAPGETRMVQVRVRKGTSFNKNTGISFEITVEEDDGYVVADGQYQIETYNGTAYSGGNISFNGGRPF